MPYKPEGYTSVAPYLIVDGADRTIEFLMKAFGAVELRRFPAPDGGIMHAEVRIDDTVLMLGDSGPGFPAVPAHVHVYVADVDATYQKALSAGATIVSANAGAAAHAMAMEQTRPNRPLRPRGARADMIPSRFTVSLDSSNETTV